MLRFLTRQGLDRHADPLGLSPEEVASAAYLIGPANIPVASEITAERGRVVCTKPAPDASALAVPIRLGPDELKLISTAGEAALPELPFPLSPLGELMLRTCLLPDRERPYLLSLELARHQLMLFLNKLEDWQLTDLPADSPVMRLFEAARRSFTDALVSPRTGGTNPGSEDNERGGFTATADALALRALWLATEAGERLSLLSAAREFEPRMTGRVYQAVAEIVARGGSEVRKGAVLTSTERTGVVVSTRPAVGCSVSPAQFTDPLKQALGGSVDFLATPMRWLDLEPNEGEYRFGPTDRWIEWAVRTAKLPVVAGPVIDLRPGSAPDWLFIWDNDYETLRGLVYDHVKAVITRYRRTVQRWTVVSGLHVGEHVGLNLDQVMDLTRISVIAVKKLHPKARVQVELVQPWAEYFVTGRRRGLAPVMYGELINQAGIPVDAFSLRIAMGSPGPGQATRDLMAFAAMLDRYAGLDRPLAISAVGVPSRTQPAATDNGQTRSGGWWRNPWSDDIQADWITSALGIALSRPFVESICWHELADLPRSKDMPAGGLITADGTRKPGLARLAELRKACHQKSTPARLDAFWRQSVGV